jgi:hypothetical protein
MEIFIFWVSSALFDPAEPARVDSERGETIKALVLANPHQAGRRTVSGHVRLSRRGLIS